MAPVIWFRHLLGPDPEADLEAIGAEVRDALRALPALDFGVWVSYRTAGARRVARAWRPWGVRVVREPARGSGAALIGSLLDPEGKIYPKSESKSPRALLDWDARDLRDPRVREGALRVFEEMRGAGALLGLGNRDCVVLDPDPVLDRARQITEMFHAGFVRGLGRDLHPANPRRVPLRVPGAYRRFGDPIPGFYAVDPAHPRFPFFRARVLKDAARADLDGYAGDSCLVMCAAVLAPVASAVVPVRPRPGPPGSYTLRTIGAVHRELGRTSIGPSYRRWLAEDRRFIGALVRHYPRRAVEEVRRRALRGLEGRTQ